ncbi:MAG: T9SS type A sorting domain-containing protein, partial [Flavobacteriales bacterium]|nr:T9SS type A sorting domain-containing protein [Flavobacteriales bacterium]
TIVVNPNTVATIVANGPISLCSVNEVQLSSASDIPTWSTGSSDTTISVIQTEMIELLVTNEFGCTDTDSLSITVFELPVVTAEEDTSACISNGPFTLDATPALGTWTGLNVANNTFSPTTEGTFGFQYSFTDGNGCTNIDSTFFTVAIPLQITAGPDVSVCMPSDLIDLAANASPAGGIWSGFGVTAEGSVLPILSGSYAYTYSFQDLCATTDTMYVNSYDAPAPPVIGGELFICKNVPSALWSNYIGGNLWTTSDPSDTIYIIDAGTYGVTYTDDNGCSSFSEVVVQQYPEPQIPAISGEPNAVYNNTYSYAVASLPDYTYNWIVTGGTIISGQGTNVIEVVWDQFITGVGEIQMTWANAYGCESTQFYAVNVDVSVEEIFASNLRIYPNPTRDVVNIQWDFMNENTYLSVYDNAGKLLSTNKLNNQSLQQVDLSGYENGVYQLRLSNENAVIMRAIVVTR